MQNINSGSELRAAIIHLEQQYHDDYKELKEQWRLVNESIKPMNILKRTLNEVANSLDIKDNLFTSSVAISVGIASKLFIIGKSRNPYRKLLGAALTYGATTLVAKHPDAAKNIGSFVLNIVSGRHRNPREHTVEEI